MRVQEPEEEKATEYSTDPCRQFSPSGQHPSGDPPGWWAKEGSLPAPPNQPFSQSSYRGLPACRARRGSRWDIPLPREGRSSINAEWGRCASVTLQAESRDAGLVMLSAPSGIRGSSCQVQNFQEERSPELIYTHELIHFSLGTCPRKILLID